MAHEINSPTTGEPNELNNQTHRLAIDVLTAFWQAVYANKHWWHSQGFGPVVNCCILGALTVRDILHGMGRTDAIVQKSGLHIQAYKHTLPHHSVTIGSPFAPSMKGHWNAHMVVQLGNFIIDPTIGQAQRPWNGLPESAVFENHVGAGDQLQFSEDCLVRVTTKYAYRNDENDIVLYYFKPSFAVDWKTRKWRKAPDANYARRARLVATALTILKAQMPVAA